MSRFVAEAILILLSVAIGFAAAEFGDYREERRLSAFVRRNVVAEVEANAAVLEALLPKHRQWQTALAADNGNAPGTAAYEVMFALRPGDVPIGLPLKRAAWSTAVSTGALRLLDYEVAEALSEIYAYQDIMTENHNRLVSSSFYSAQTFDPATRPQAIRLLWGVMAEISGNEETLLAMYHKHLPLLRAASQD